jgi:DNA-binding CsgD family transcriptional regulator
VAESDDGSGEAARRAAGYQLTPRELTVLMLLADGMTANAIARRLHITTRTVNKHLENVYRKLGTGDRLTAVLRAQTFGLIPATGNT